MATSVFAAGKIQNADVKSLSEVGNVSSRLINDTKLHSTISGTQLSSLLTNLVKFVAPFYIGTVETGDKSPWIQLPFAHTIASTYAIAKTAGSSASTINIYRMTQAEAQGGASVWTSIFSTPITLDANEHSTATAATAAVISGASGAANDHYKMEFTTVGTSVDDVTVEMVITTN